MSILEIDTVSFDEATRELVIIDQTLLPGRLELMRLSDAASIREAIRRLCVRGAPAIGVAAALGLYACAVRIAPEADFAAEFARCAKQIETARPTAVNLSWAVKRMRKAACAPQPLEALRAEAFAIRDEDIRVCQSIGENGLALVRMETASSPIAMRASWRPCAMARRSRPSMWARGAACIFACIRMKRGRSCRARGFPPTKWWRRAWRPPCCATTWPPA